MDAINYALVIKKDDIKLDRNTSYYKEYDKFTVVYDPEMSGSGISRSGYTLKFNDTNLTITHINTYKMEEELYKRDFSNDELFDFFLWYEVMGSLIETELFMHNMELIPEDTILRAKELTDSLLTTCGNSTFTNQRLDKIFENLEKSVINTNYRISKKEEEKEDEL